MNNQMVVVVKFAENTFNKMDVMNGRPWKMAKIVILILVIQTLEEEVVQVGVQEVVLVVAVTNIVAEPIKVVVKITVHIIVLQQIMYVRMEVVNMIPNKRIIQILVGEQKEVVVPVRVIVHMIVRVVVIL
jgi:hypothetical protein